MNMYPIENVEKNILMKNKPNRLYFSTSMQTKKKNFYDDPIN